MESEDEAKQLWRQGRRDVTSAAILAIVLMCGVLLVGDYFPEWLIDLGVPRVAAYFYWLPILVFGPTWLWREGRWKIRTACRWLGQATVEPGALDRAAR